MSDNTELLERAVINLTLENASLKTEVKSLTKDKMQWFKWHNEKREELEEAEKALADLKSAQENHNKELVESVSK